MTEVDFATLPAAVLAFRPTCPGCTPRQLVEPGAKPCSAYDCPGLPGELQVTCPVCMYDFAADDGLVKCDHSTCEAAIRLRGNVPTYRKWLAYLGQLNPAG